MARYIDADALIKKIFPMGIGDGMYTINAKAVRFAIDNAPTADVAPKSEVAREIFEEIEFDIHQLMFERDETRAIAIEGVIAELKKKYTGEQT